MLLRKQVVIISYLSKVRELEVIKTHGVALCYHLSDKGINYSKGFTGSRGSDKQGAPERIYNIYPPIMNLLFVIKLHGNID